MALLHVTARGHTRIPFWILDHVGTAQSLSKLASVAFMAVSVTNDDGSPRKGLAGSAFSLLLLATPDAVAEQDAFVALLREESLPGFYSLVFAPPGKKKWPTGGFAVALEVKVTKKTGNRTVTSQGRTVVRVERD
jgi:hypothetical protein